MAKFNKKIVEEARQWVAINGLNENGGAKVKDFCEQFSITDATHYHWLEGHAEYREAIEDGRAIFKRGLPNVLVKSLMESAKGGHHEETSESEVTRYIPDKNGKPQIKDVTKTKSKHNRYMPPNTAAAIFLLTNLDPEHWQNRQRQDVTVKAAKEEEKSLEELEAEIARLSKLDETDTKQDETQSEEETESKEE